MLQKMKKKQSSTLDKKSKTEPSQAEPEEKKSDMQI
jgi:hypothetical protein